VKAVAQMTFNAGDTAVGVKNYLSEKASWVATAVGMAASAVGMETVGDKLQEAGLATRKSVATSREASEQSRENMSEFMKKDTVELMGDAAETSKGFMGKMGEFLSTPTG